MADGAVGVGRGWLTRPWPAAAQLQPLSVWGAQEQPAASDAIGRGRGPRRGHRRVFDRQRGRAQGRRRASRGRARPRPRASTSRVRRISPVSVLIGRHLLAQPMNMATELLLRSVIKPSTCEAEPAICPECCRSAGENTRQYVVCARHVQWTNMGRQCDLGHLTGFENQNAMPKLPSFAKSDTSPFSVT